MFNLFPSLLDFSMLAPLILRAVLGIIFVKFALQKFSPSYKEISLEQFSKLGLNQSLVPIVGFIEFVVGASLIIGVYTQLAGILAGLISLVTYILMKKRDVELSHTKDFFFLLFIISLTLILTGAGSFAFDLPL